MMKKAMTPASMEPVELVSSQRMYLLCVKATQPRSPTNRSHVVSGTLSRAKCRA